MAGLGVCRVDDIALSVLATVIGHQREKGWIITDAGWMALSRDRGTAKQNVDLSRYPVGTRLRILPNHACATAAQHDAYHVVRNGPGIVARWPRFGGW